jgi:sigma-E factor negative regulatory protein RseB
MSPKFYFLREFYSLRALLPVLCLAAISQSALAEEDLWATMQKTASAARELNY